MRKLSAVLAGLVACSAIAVSAASTAAASSTTYSDIGSLTSLGQRSIENVTTLGLMQAESPGVFDPYGAVTVAQAVTGVVQVLGIAPDASASQTYSDVPSSSADFGSIEAAVAAGLMTGWAPAAGALGAGGPITRAQMAVLTTNAMRMQATASSMLSNVTTFGYLRDLTYAGYYLGDVNAMLLRAVEPPIDHSAYWAHAKVDRELLAVTLWRLYMYIDIPHTLSLVPQHLVLALPNVPDGLTLTWLDRLGLDVPGAWRHLYPATYSLSAGAAATVSPSGGAAGDTATFVASEQGTYPVQASVDGPFMATSVNATTNIRVMAPRPAGWLSCSPNPFAFTVNTLTCTLVLNGPHGAPVTGVAGLITISASSGIFVPSPPPVESSPGVYTFPVNPVEMFGNTGTVSATYGGATYSTTLTRIPPGP